MKRYKELKYEGNVYTESYKINEILIKQGFSWFLDCEVENMRLEILKETLIINAGVFFNGTFEYGVVRDVEWKFGTFVNGVWYNGTWRNGVFKNGIIFNGKFFSGSIVEGVIKGGEFISCEISNTVKREKAQIQAPVQPQAQSQAQVQSQVQSETQSQTQEPVQEKHIIKRFKDFHV